MQNSELQTQLLAAMPQWHYWIAKPFIKQVVDKGVSGGMYYCIQMLREHGDTITMSEMARSVHCSKQQMTKTVNKLIECGFVERVPDPADRRIIRLGLTKDGNDFIDRFLAMSAGCYQHMFEQMTDAEQKEFSAALGTMNRIFARMFRDEQKNPDAT